MVGWAAIFVVLTAGLGGCGKNKGDKGLGSTATVATAPTTIGGGPSSSTVAGAPGTTTTVPFEGDPYTIPAVIDVAYVNRVLSGLDHALGDIVRELVAVKGLPVAPIERLRSLYNEPALQLRIDGLQDDHFKRFIDYQYPPGDQRTVVTQLLAASQMCMFAEVRRDFSAVAVDPLPPSTVWIALKQLDSQRDTRGANPTGWAYVYDGFDLGRVKPENPCDA